ncbi:MAG TPA: peptidoglycan-binding domain-containing protein [Pyrinomonadaceae bacterium]|jgi:peptidoglycan hydrolase-like protein with peptidoglycan-binding domain
MKRTLTALLTVLLLSSLALAIQNGNSNNPTMVATNANNNNNANSNKKKRGPVFRANKDQIKQAQAILKQRAFYSGEETGKLDPDTRAGLKKYQAAEQLKVTGTLNKVTLEKMKIQLTDKQKAM